MYFQCYTYNMERHHHQNLLTGRAIDCVSKLLEIPEYQIEARSVSGGFSRNRRALVSANNRTLFVKEVDTDLLSDDGERELEWLRKDYETVRLLQSRRPELVADWVELSDDGYVLLMSAYTAEDGWLWSLPDDPETAHDYINAVVRTVRALEGAQFDEEALERLQLQPHFRDEIVLDNKYPSIYEDVTTRQKLIERYQMAVNDNERYLSRYVAMVDLLGDELAMSQLQQDAYQLMVQPQDKFGHCDVRSDNIAYNPTTGAVKLVDWNWASYAPERFGSTEFLLDMARHGHDVTPWLDQLNPAMLAASINFFAVRCLQPPLAPGNALRDMQFNSAATAYELYRRMQ